MMVSRSICRIKLSTFMHQFAYNSPESVVEYEIEQELICAKHTHIYTNPKYEIQYFLGICLMVGVTQVSQSPLL